MLPDGGWARYSRRSPMYLEKMEDQLVRNILTKWRFVVLLAVFAMVAAACQSETTVTTAAGGETTTTKAPATTTTTEAPAPPGFSYNIAIFSDPTTDNPWAAIDTENDVWTSYVNPGMPSLYTYQPPSYTLIPVLAADDSPPAVVADGDNFSVTVNLNKDITWSDGEIVDANDVLFTYNTVVKYGGLGGNFPDVWPISLDGGDGIVAVEAIDDFTVKITFNFDVGLSVWPFSVGTAPIYPEHFWGPLADAAPDAETFYTNSGIDGPNGSAFRIAQREPGAFWRNEAIENYWDAGSHYTVYDTGTVEYTRNGVTETYGSGDKTQDLVADYTEGPFASEVVYSLYSDQNSAVLALTDGEVDYLLNPLGLQRGLQQLVLAAPDLNVIVNQSNGFRYLAYNTRKFPMSEKSFRQALACRIDKEFMANTVLGGAAIATNSLVPPGNAFWYNPGLTAMCDGQGEKERFESAVQILKDAGWTWTVDPAWSDDNRDVLPKGEGMKGPDGTVVQPLTLYAPGPGYDPLRATYSLFIEEWAADLGIPLTAEPTGFSVIVDKVFAEGDAVMDWDMYILGWGLGIFPDHVFLFFDSAQDSRNGGFNTPGYNNPEFDALSAQFDRAKTLSEARDLVFQGDAMISEDLPYVVLFATPIIEAYRNSLEFPFTTVLDGLQNFGGVPASAKSS